MCKFLIKKLLVLVEDRSTRSQRVNDHTVSYYSTVQYKHLPEIWEMPARQSTITSHAVDTPPVCPLTGFTCDAVTFCPSPNCT